MTHNLENLGTSHKNSIASMITQLIKLNGPYKLSQYVEIDSVKGMA